MDDESLHDSNWETFKAEYEAKEGQIWVCPACEKTAKNKFDIPDTSCWTWAVLCYEERTPDGLFQRVPEST